MKAHTERRSSERRSKRERREKVDLRYEDPYFRHKVEKRTKNERRDDDRRKEA